MPANIPAATLALHRVVGNQATTAILQRNGVKDLVAMHERLIAEATPQQPTPAGNRGRRAPAEVPNAVPAPAPAVVLKSQPTSVTTVEAEPVAVAEPPDELDISTVAQLPSTLPGSVNGGSQATAAVVLQSPPAASTEALSAAEPGGLLEALRNRGAALGTRGGQEAQKLKPPKEYGSATEGIEVENPLAYRVLLQSSKAQGVMAWVEDDKGDKLAEFTTDMGSNPYTIENRTTPCESADRNGIAARKRALEMLSRHIQTAADAAPTGLLPSGTYKTSDEQKWHTTNPDKGSAVTAGTEGNLKLIVKQANHRVVPKGGGAVPGVQITKGVAFSQMLEAAPTGKGAFSHAQWLTEYPFYFKHYVAKCVPAQNRGAPPPEATVFGMLASLLHFYLRRLDFNARASAGSNPWTPKEGVGGQAVMDDNEIAFPDMTHPPVKNAWGLLPKTPPAKWLADLDGEAQARVKQALRDVPTAVTENQVNATAWKQVYQTVVFQGQMIAGHAVPDFRIAGETGFAFEIRTPKRDEKSGYGY